MAPRASTPPCTTPSTPSKVCSARKNRTSPRREVVHSTEPGRGALRRGDWKLLESGGAGDGPLELFDLASDSGERENQAARRPDKVRELLERLEAYRGGDR